MRVLLRADASVSLGSGHIMRCLTIAKALQQHGSVCDFICRQHDGNLIDWLRKQNINVIAIPQQISTEQEDAQHCLFRLRGKYHLLIVDHYLLGLEFCTIMRSRFDKIMVIDDLANRRHDCDLLLDQNLLPDADFRYQHLVPVYCKQLLGPKYALLRDEFYQDQNFIPTQHILVGFGGSDEQNLTKLALDAIDKLKFMSITADIVIGANNPWHVSLEKQIASMSNVQLHVQCNNISKLMRRARIMLGAGGSTHWERCIRGLPGLIVTVAENQQATTAYLHELGACVWLGKATEMSAEFFKEQLYYYLSQPALLDEISLQAKSLLPANAGMPLVKEQILNLVAKR